MHARSFPPHLPGSRALLAPVLLVAALIAIAAAFPVAVRAHAELDRSEPAQGTILAAPPSEVDLWFTEPVNGTDGTLAVTLRTSDNTVIESTSLTVDPDDPFHVIATFSGLSYETFTVVWSNRSVTDGHPISGSFAFRVGGGPTAGAATTEGETPALWAVITRWLTFAGLAVAAGGFFIARLIARPAAGIARTTTDGGEDGRVAPTLAQRLTLLGAVVALAATLSEIPFQLAFPAFDSEDVSFGNILRGLPNAWWFRPAGALAATALALLWLMPRPASRSAVMGVVARASIPADRAPANAVPARRSMPLIEWPGLATALVGLLGLALTGHSAAQTGVWHAPAVASNILHQGAAALWAGGLVMLAIVRWSGPRNADAAEGVRVDPVRRFSPWALGLFVVAVATGIANAGIILPSVSSLWDSRYGVTILVKSAIVLGALGLAAWHRQALARATTWATTRLRPTLRIESVVVVAIVLAASILAMTSPPSGTALNRDPLAANVHLLEQAVTSDGTVVGLMTLESDPLRPGETNTFTITSIQQDGSTLPIPDGSRVFLDFSSLLDGAITPPRLELAPTGDGRYTGAGDQLSIESWWEVRATIRMAGQPDHTALFPVLLPDPNLYGEDAVETYDSDPAAEALYQRAFDHSANVASMVDRQHISSGGAGAVFSVETIIPGENGQPNSYEMALSSYAPGKTPTASMIRRIGEESWNSSDGGASWISTFSVSAALSPAEVMEQYEGATGFRLGRQQEVNGELSQAVIFVVPETTYATTWYVWWVGLESGQRHTELMVTGGHYMIKTLEYDTGATVAPPDPATVVNRPG